MQRSFPIAGLAALATWLALLALACTTPEESSKPAKTGRPLRVAYIDYRSQKRFELVNESHTDRLEQYSKVRADASRKVQTDEVLDALVEHLLGAGYGEREQAGAAPGELPSGSTLAMAVEVEREGVTTHVPGYRGMDPKEKERVLAFAQAILDTYNATYSLQAVEGKPGELPFEAPTPPARIKGQAGGGGQ